MSEVATSPLEPELLRRMDAYWRAANYLTVGQIYLQDNPLLEAPLTFDHIKPRLLGHWGTTTGLNFLYVHLNRLIKQNDLDMIYIIGPGHGGPGLVAPYLSGGIVHRALSGDRTQPVRIASDCSGNSPGPTAFPATYRRTFRARSTKEASSAIPSPMPMAQRSTTPT